MSDHGVRIGEAAALFGLAPSTLRWWERQGVLSPSAGQGGRRRYREPELRRLGLAYLCRVTGMMPLDSTAVVASGRAGLAAWRGTMAAEAAELGRRIERLTAARSYLLELLRCHDDDPAQCPYLDPELDRHTPRGRLPAPDLVTAARAARRRDEKPPAAAARDENRPCPCCRRPVPRPARGRPRTYCTHACRQRAYRARRAAGRPGGAGTDAPAAASGSGPRPD
ncbi:MerR family DNA-binding transcriptional regulator [Allonocardiopsis opalescens]|uniref:DNA-binding transcriptional MerR regulator n=1 Tax=Allonocardiopsis opalescens TaxID=1144618 RepID=A0A2T0Q795_9ACTN|nr:MerR family DNA-binding transcriptional regulator [Allonocardiopsis opalescens]PRX99707.1 DNA-binding transcriptional MerR regulator [Allonocardiopsis opalescens]